MNCMTTILFLYPDADPVRDFIVQNDGPTPKYLKDSPMRQYLRESATDKEPSKWVEGNDYVLLPVPLNELEEGVDYVIEEKGPYIAAWNLDTPQPTEAELQAAWEAYQEAEANKPPKLTDMEQLQAENAALVLELAQTQTRLGQAEQEQASLIVSLVEGGLL